MRKWESVLRRDESAWQDFKAWLAEMKQFQVNVLLQASNDTGASRRPAEHMLGMIEGVERIIIAATANEREEIQRARAG
jgi:hypothetical protein